MKLQQLLTIMFLSTSLLFADNFHNQLIIPSVKVDAPFWEFAGQPIRQKETGAFAQLVTKWNDKLAAMWTALDEKLQEDLGVTTQNIDYYLEQEMFLSVYSNYYKKYYASILENNKNLDPALLNFVQCKLYYLQCNKFVKIYSSENISPLTVSFGADKKDHYLILNTSAYNLDTIQQVYDIAMQKTPKFHIIPHTNIHQSRAIEYANLLHLGISQALNSIVHQSDYFSKILYFFTYNDQTASKETQAYGTEYIYFHTLLEACLQSNNPLEAALFVEPQVDVLSQNFIILWRDFIDDISDCYNEDDLDAYETLSLKERREALYTSQD